MKYLYISRNQSISFNEDYWYINGIEQKRPIEEIRTTEELAKNGTKQYMRSLLTNLFSHFKHIAILTAAGTSMDNGTHRGKTREGLWKECRDDIKTIIRELHKKQACSHKMKAIVREKNIEEFLSYLILFEKINDEIKDSAGNSLKENIEKKIANACNLQLDKSNKHHGELLNRLVARKPSDPRVQLFTTNYDTLFEQAAKKRGFTIIDGFSFSFPRYFAGKNFDYDIVYREKTRLKQEESFVPNIFHLYKLHGSIDWEKDENGIIQQTEKPLKPCIIYPASEKYESSYEQPYFEMMARFQQTLRQESTLLIVIGFGFQDKHIQNVIKEAVFQNPNFHLVIINYNKKDDDETGILPNLLPDYIDHNMSTESNVSIFFSTFKDFVETFPTNQSYYKSERLEDNGTIQP